MAFLRFARCVRSRLCSELLITVDDIGVCVISGACFSLPLMHRFSGRKQFPDPANPWWIEECLLLRVMQATKCDELYGDKRQRSHQTFVVKLMSTLLPCSNSILVTVIDVWRPVLCTFTRRLATECLQFLGVNWWYGTDSCFGYALAVLGLTNLCFIE